MIKDRDYMCPECGEQVYLSCNDYNVDMDGATWDYTCDKCGANWQEHYSCVYSGYSTKTKVFNEEGICIWEKNQNL